MAEPTVSAPNVVAFRYNLTPPTYADGAAGWGQIDANGNLKIALGALTAQSAFDTAVGTELTRPSDANAYAIGDAIANDTTAANVTPLTFTAARTAGFPGSIVGADIIIDSATAFGSIRLHLFNQAPFAAAGYQADNAALALTYTALKVGAAGSLPNYVGYIDFTTWVAQSGSAVAAGLMQFAALPFVPAAASRSIYGLLEARAAFTPKNGGKFSVVLHLVQD